MEWIEKISNNDNIIENIIYSQNNISILVRLWNGKKITLIPKNCWMIKDKNSILEEIGDVIILNESISLEEIKSDIINGNGSEKEYENLKAFVFKNSWNDRNILEIVCENILYFDFINGL